MKKIISIFFVAVWAMASMSSCGGDEAEFDKKLQTAFNEMEKTNSLSIHMCAETIIAWGDAIYKDVTPSGKRCNDFNEALDEVFSSFRDTGLYDSLEIYKKNMEIATSKLNNPPSSRKECYDDFVNIVSEVSSFSRMADNPYGNYKSFESEARNKLENIAKDVDNFKIKYAEYIKLEDLQKESSE